MSEERGISMTEFKTVVEGFRSEIRKVAEVTNHLFSKFENMEKDIQIIKQDVSILKIDVSILKTDVSILKTDVSGLKTDSIGLKEQVGLLMEGQTEIKAELRSGLKDRVTYQAFNKLEKRVVRLEKKSA